MGHAGEHEAFEVPTGETVPWTAPVPDNFTKPWWAACRARRLLVRRCGGCGRLHFPPRPACPYCWSEEVDWYETSGAGTIYTFSIVRENDMAPFSRSLPYVPAIVALNEGPRLMTTIIESPWRAIAVGAAVIVSFVDREDWTFPAFRVR
ncbi:MAG TPA: OB-fold domain-containing protein [Acidimicrobiales bacterium]|nr:OB-fold domain-containing protein [Acidimicrobiales bacterium]